MNEIEQLKSLLDSNGPAVPLYVLARYCNCTSASIQNYIRGRSTPNGTKRLSIQEGLRAYKETIDTIIKE